MLEKLEVKEGRLEQKVASTAKIRAGRNKLQTFVTKDIEDCVKRMFLLEKSLFQFFHRFLH